MRKNTLTSISPIIVCTAGALGCGASAEEPSPDAGLTSDVASAIDSCGGGSCADGAVACPAGSLWSERSGSCAAEAIVMLPMSDGVRLRSKVFLPQRVPAPGVATLLERTPYRYPAADASLTARARFFSARGYAYVLQDVRGRFDSEGRFVPRLHEFKDGRETTDWIVMQPWSNGKIGTLGGSYVGLTAIAAAVDNPNVAVVVADDAPEDFRYSMIGGMINSWPVRWAHALEHGAFPGLAATTALTNTLDLQGIDLGLLGREEPIWREFLAAGTPDATYWNARTLVGRYGQICAPVMSIKSDGAWGDPVRIWEGLREHGCERQRAAHRLILTPDAHVYHLARIAKEQTPVTEAMVDFIDHHLRGTDAAEAPAPVLHRSPSLNAYRPLETWPPPVIEQTLHLGRVGGDRALLPRAQSAALHDDLAVDPAQDDPCAEDYPYVAYSTAALATPLELHGRPTLELQLQLSTPDADVLARLYEVRPGGAFTLVTAGMLRARYREGFAAPVPVTPGEMFEVEIAMAPAAYHFGAGNYLVLVLASGTCGVPENPNTGEPITAQTHWAATTLRFFSGAATPSRLRLPVAGH